MCPAWRKVVVAFQKGKVVEGGKSLGKKVRDRIMKAFEAKLKELVWDLREPYMGGAGDIS